LNSIPPNEFSFLVKCHDFGSWWANVSEYVYKKLTINGKITLLYSFSLSNVRQGGFIKGTGSELPDC
jgi:hypothetical protein